MWTLLVLPCSMATRICNTEIGGHDVFLELLSPVSISDRATLRYLRGMHGTRRWTRLSERRTDISCRRSDRFPNFRSPKLRDRRSRQCRRARSQTVLFEAGKISLAGNPRRFGGQLPLRRSPGEFERWRYSQNCDLCSTRNSLAIPPVNSPLSIYKVDTEWINEWMNEWDKWFTWQNRELECRLGPRIL